MLVVLLKLFHRLSSQPLFRTSDLIARSGWRRSRMTPNDSLSSSRTEKSSSSRAGVAREDEDFSVLLDHNESFGVIRDLLHPERAIKSEVRKSGCELKRWKSFSSTTSIKNRQKGEDETKAFGHVHARGK